MTAKIDNITDKSNVVYFKNYFDKQKLKTKTSTIAAIIALKIDHPDDINPEDFFIENIESNFDIEVLAFEDIISNISSANLLVAPITFVGLTALSVEINTKFSTLFLTAASAHVTVPKIFVSTPAKTFFSTSGTCLYAAA